MKITTIRIFKIAIAIAIIMEVVGMGNSTTMQEVEEMDILIRMVPISTDLINKEVKSKGLIKVPLDRLEEFTTLSRMWIIALTQKMKR